MLAGTIPEHAARMLAGACSPAYQIARLLLSYHDIMLAVNGKQLMWTSSSCANNL